MDLITHAGCNTLGLPRGSRLGGDGSAKWRWVESGEWRNAEGK